MLRCIMEEGKCFAADARAQRETGTGMAKPTLTISSKTYSAWSLRGWLLTRLAGIEVEEKRVEHDASDRAELLLLSPSVLVPRLNYKDISVWDTLAIAESLNESVPQAKMLPEDRVARAHCRSISGEIHSGFANLRSALPMNLKAHYKTFKIFAGAQPDIDRIQTIWTECLEKYGGPFLFGAPTIADAMFAPVCTRFLTYSVKISGPVKAYCDTIMAWAPMREWVDAAISEPEEMEELALHTFHQPFDLVQGPLYRVEVLRRAPDDHQKFLLECRLSYLVEPNARWQCDLP